MRIDIYHHFVHDGELIAEIKKLLKETERRIMGALTDKVEEVKQAFSDGLSATEARIIEEIEQAAGSITDAESAKTALDNLKTNVTEAFATLSDKVDTIIPDEPTE